MGAQSRWVPLNSTANLAASGFLDIVDVTDTLAQRFIKANDTRIQSWLDWVDGQILCIAQQVDVTLTSISIPLHPKIYELAIKFFYVKCFEDCWGANNNIQTSNETIFLKLKEYKKDIEKLKLECTYEMFMYTNLSLNAQQTASGTISLLRA